MTGNNSRWAARAALIPCTAMLAVLTGVPADAATTTSSANSLTVFASAPSGAVKPDDITMLDGLLYVTYQNNAGPDGSPTGSHSTVVALDSAGHAAQVWSIAGRVDGLTADPARHRVLATANEDLNSSLYAITPGDKTPTHYTYSPDPAQKGTDGSNGGTDSISIAADGSIYLAHSNPDLTLPTPNNAPALYRATLSGSTASLTPVFGVNDRAAVINPAAGAPAVTKMMLTDPDSNRIITVAGQPTLVQDAQGDSKLVFVSGLTAATPTLKQLNLHNATGAAAITPQLDDLEQITGPGTLYIADQGSGVIYALDTAAMTPGTIVVSQPKPGKGDLANRAGVGTLDPATGIVTSLLTAPRSPKGLLFVPAAASTSSTGVTPPQAVNSGRADPGTPNPALIISGATLLSIAAAAALIITGRRRTPRR